MNYFFGFILSTTLLTAQSFQSVVQRLEQTPVENRQAVIEQYLNSKSGSPIIEQDSVVHFVLYGNADTVYVNGNLQHWNDPVLLHKIPCGHYSLFYRTFIAPPDARLDYKLIVDGKDITDPHNPYITPSGFGPHSEVRMPKFISSPYLVPRNNIAHGEIDSLAPLLKIPPPLNQYIPVTRPIKIYRPAGYDTLQRLPVVYIHDGFDAINFAFVPRIIDNLIADGKIRPIIAVFIPPVDRNDEYIGRKRELFVKYLTNDIVPLIDRLYKTEQSSLQRAMMGISNGGHISLYTVLKHPEMFQNVGGQSSTMTPWLKELTEEQYRANRISPQLKLYMDCGRYDIKFQSPFFGNYEFLQMNREYSDLLSSHRIPHYYKEVNDGHEWANWRERMPEMLIYFFGTQQ
ncbi:MAG: alpha/beta hydrolase-fold protein [Bacteroidetes bacterium]|nr:alpha/beta hydrolase-fold protein [Bacteroidota bacterium]